MACWVSTACLAVCLSVSLVAGCEQANYMSSVPPSSYCVSLIGYGVEYARQKCDCPEGQSQSGPILGTACDARPYLGCLEYQLNVRRSEGCLLRLFPNQLTEAIARGELEYDGAAAAYRVRVISNGSECGDEAALFTGGGPLTRRFVATKYDVVSGKARIGDRCQLVPGESALLPCWEGICAAAADGVTRCLAPATEGVRCPSHELGCAHPDEPIGFSRLYCDTSTNTCRAIKSSGLPCGASEECQSRYCASGRCVEKKADGVACTSAVECASGTCGARGACVSKKANNEPCTTPLECAAGACVMGRCRAFACGMEP